ncbi:MAG: YHS domain-containing protein, partial [Chloroflexota bacterium]
LDDEAIEATDPVCGMVVTIEGAEYVTTYKDERFYFCCDGCRTTFEQDPSAYLDQPTPSGEAIDPICGMTVDIATAKYMSSYNDVFYYFCAAGCKATFDKAPQTYMEKALE